LAVLIHFVGVPLSCAQPPLSFVAVVFLSFGKRALPFIEALPSSAQCVVGQVDYPWYDKKLYQQSEWFL
jgi:hypothetical protein